MHKAVQGGTTSHYVYDADGKRVRRIIGSTETWMIYGVDGELVAEYAAATLATSPQKEYGYHTRNWPESSAVRANQPFLHSKRQLTNPLPSPITPKALM